MSNSHHVLVSSIQQLHEYLEQHEPLDAAARQALLSIMGEIQRALESQPSAESNATSAESPASLASQLTDWIAELEAKHPQLTQTLSQVADRLSDMGI